MPVQPSRDVEDPTEGFGVPGGTRRRRWPLVVVPLLVVGMIAAGAVIAANWPTDNERTGGPTSATTVAAPVCGWADDFTGTAIDPAWERVRADAGSRIAAGTLELDAPNGSDIFDNQLQAPMLLRAIPGGGDGDVVLETDVSAQPAQYYQGAGLVLWNGSGSYVRLERGFGDVGAITFEYKRDGGKHTKVHSPNASDPNVVKTDAARVILQLTRSSETVSARWRPFGQTGWSDLGTIDIALPTSTKIGIAVLNRAQNGSEPTDFRAGFDYVKASC